MTDIESPVTGSIWKLTVAVGDAVAEGDSVAAGDHLVSLG